MTMALIHITISGKISDKTYKDHDLYKKQKKQEIVNAICALLNSNGGKVEIRGEETEGNLLSTTILHSLTRMFEQSLVSRFGAQINESFINFEYKHEKIIAISVTKADFLVTFKYNLYFTTKTQVEIIDNVRNALKIINERFVDQPVQLGSHQKTFHKNRNCSFRENEIIQFKLVKSDSSKRVTLADRMAGKSNKFSCYVSAFANHRGGHIYYGIDDDGVVQGENTENISEIEKKVEKAIQKMIWPDVIGQPKRGKHWEIFFEPVLDEKSNLIPSTFVIVIFIAPCCGGVFTEEPESYEMVQGKVERMSFKTWKEKLQPVGLNKRKQEVPPTVKRISLSPAATKRCININEVLTEAINKGDWKSFARSADHLEQKYSKNPEVKLVVYLRKLMGTYRQGGDPSSLITEYRGRLSRAGEPFESFFRFSENVVAHVSGKAAIESQDISTDALAIAEIMEHGFLTAADFLIVALIYDGQNDKGPSPVELCLMARDHLDYVEGAHVARPDMIHAVHIILAAYQLGYNMQGKVIKKVIEKESFEEAKKSIMAVNQAVCNGNPLLPYREIWFKLVQSMLFIRHAQFQPDNRTKFLKDAFQFAKKAKDLAKDSGLKEMVCWARTAIASCTEALVLAKLTRKKNIKVYKVLHVNIA
ncbi:uncharacterized protein LOC114526839 [Dendronephthya gigantea]|uniref:uncharacterized protein LOC114526839 n=1 Tax=Dendronephthya gigantea TaxID=151771 RepID=UPI00106CAA25|nr:uncharacterized protein LOC114526839 [Dendronephthya gigantea]